MTKKVKYTQPLIGEANAAGDLRLVPGAVVEILQDGEPVTVYSDEDGTEIDTPTVPSGVASGTAGVSTRGELTVWLKPGSGYSGVATVGQAVTTFPIPDISPDVDDVVADGAVVKLIGPQTIADVKTFTSPPVVPDSAFAVAKVSGLQTALDGRARLDGSTTTDTVRLWIGPDYTDLKMAPYGYSDEAKLTIVNQSNGSEIEPDLLRVVVSDQDVVSFRINGAGHMVCTRSLQIHGESRRVCDIHTRVNGVPDVLDDWMLYIRSDETPTCPVAVFGANLGGVGDEYKAQPVIAVADTTSYVTGAWYGSGVLAVGVGWDESHTWMKDETRQVVIPNNRHFSAMKVDNVTPVTLIGLDTNNRTFIGSSADDGGFTDGVIDIGSLNTVTSATASFQPQDIGKTITVNGAGAAGAVHTTTIATRISATQVTLTAPAITAVTGATGNIVGRTPRQTRTGGPLFVGADAVQAAQLHVKLPANASNWSVAMLDAATGQSVDILQLRNQAGAVLTAFRSDGKFKSPTTGITNSTDVGPDLVFGATSATFTSRGTSHIPLETRAVASQAADLFRATGPARHARLPPGRQERLRPHVQEHRARRRRHRRRRHGDVVQPRQRGGQRQLEGQDPRRHRGPFAREHDAVTEIPEWVATLVGSLVMENHAMRRALTEAQQPPTERPPTEPPPTTGREVT